MTRNQLTSLFSKQSAPLVIIAVLLLALPVVLTLSQQQQETRSRAAGLNNPLAGLNLAFPFKYQQYYSVADQWESTRPADAALMRTLGNQQKAVWYGEDWAPANTIAASVDSVLNEAAALGATPVFIAYSIPKRDCAGYSGGGSVSMEAYQKCIQQYANGINSRRAIIILEPDALANLDCLSSQEQSDRLSMLQFAINTFKAAGANVYLDGGNARWIAANTMATRLNQAGVAQADGFAVNVSNFFTTQESTDYGNQISSQIGGKHFVIDTSRNGLGPYLYPQTGAAQWCNPPGRALGSRATTETGIETVDAYLWIKVPGESDGTCTEFGQNDPNAGTFMPEYALGLAQRADWINQTSPTPTVDTGVLTPTLTSVPSEFPTNTPIPTATPIPTNTPVPTSGILLNLLQNGSFENGLANWYFNARTPAAGSAKAIATTGPNGSYAAQITVTRTSSERWHVQLTQPNLSLTAGKTYTVTFWAKASKNLSIQSDMQKYGGDWAVRKSQIVTLTTNWQQYTYSFQAPVTEIDQIAFNLAQTRATVWLDNVVVSSN